MKFQKFILILLLSSLYNGLISQVIIDENINLSDTTQLHKIITNNGDIFTGRIIQMDQSEIKFLFGENTMKLLLSELESVQVINVKTENNSAGKPVQGQQHYWRFEYEVVFKNGDREIGTLSKITSCCLYLNSGTKNDAIIKMEDIDSILHIGLPFAPDPDMLPECHQLTTYSKDDFIGGILGIYDSHIHFMLINGSTLKYSLNEIWRVILQNNLEQQGYRPTKRYKDFSDNQQRVFFTPSALMLKKKVREFRSLVLLNSLDVGVSDNFTTGVGLFSVIVATAVTAKAKLGVSITDQFHVAIGGQGLLAIPSYDTDEFTLGLIYGAISVGNSRNFVNVSFGKGRSSDSFGSTSGMGFGGSITLAPNWRLNLEYANLHENGRNPFYNDSYYLGNAGLSWHKYGHQIDFGIMSTSLFDEESISLPIFGYSYKY